MQGPPNKPAILLLCNLQTWFLVVTAVSCTGGSSVTTHSATQTQNETPASADVDDKLFQLWVPSAVKCYSVLDFL